MDNIATAGDRIRAYDYNPAETEGAEIYLEGVVIAFEKSPHPAYRVLCDVSTFMNMDREGKEVLVPLALASHDFEGRIINLSK